MRKTVKRGKGEDGGLEMIGRTMEKDGGSEKDGTGIRKGGQVSE